MIDALTNMFHTGSILVIAVALYKIVKARRDLVERWSHTEFTNRATQNEILKLRQEVSDLRKHVGLPPLPAKSQADQVTKTLSDLIDDKSEQDEDGWDASLPKEEEAF